jgi:putative SOS response-associated peptidase YedK
MTELTDLMNSIHDWMLVVLPQDLESDWLTTDPDTRKDLRHPYPKDDQDAYEISTRVNNPGNDDASSSRWTTSNRALAGSVRDS